MKRFVIILLVCLVIFGCCSKRLVMTGLNHYSGWSDQIRDLAVDSWQYAQLSQAAYQDGYDFKIEKYFKLVKAFDKPDVSFYAVLYKNKSRNEHVLAFRGTDSLADFKCANIPFCQNHNKIGLSIFDNVIKEYEINEIVVTGHSLGGGIATHISLNRENLTAYYFNPSPIFKRLGKYIENDRFSIVESGEALEITRVLAREADQLYTRIGCGKGHLFTEHSMRRLATCLTQIAATMDDTAKDSLKLNNLTRQYLPKKLSNVAGIVGDEQ